jgi:hypothetical protein
MAHEILAELFTSGDKAESRSACRISEWCISRAFAATCDEIQAFSTVEIKPLFEFTVSAIEGEMLARDDQSVTLEQGWATDFEQIILHLQSPFAVHGDRVLAGIPTSVFIKIELRWHCDARRLEWLCEIVIRFADVKIANDIEFASVLISLFFPTYIETEQTIHLRDDKESCKNDQSQ